MTVSFGQRLSKSSNALLDILQRWRHPVYSGHPKVLTSMLSKLKIQNGDNVLECGAGNGVGTALLARAVGASGHVFTIDKLPKSIQAVESHLNKWQDVYRKESGIDIPNNVTALNINVKEFDSASVCLPKKFDLIFVDIGEPASSLKILSSKLKPGKYLAVYLPSVNRIVELLETIKLQFLPLVLDGVWEESLNVITLRTSSRSPDKSLSSGILKETNQSDNFEGSRYKLHVSARDESTTSFLVKFCRVSMDHETVINSGKWTFEYGDHVLFSPMQQPKKGKHRSVIVQLSKGKKFYNDWGLICLDNIESLSPGDIIQTSTGQSLYLTCPKFDEFVCHSVKITQKLSAFLPRFHHLLSLGANVCNGSQVLEVSSLGTSLSEHLSDIVGEQGHVYSVTEDTRLIKELQESWNLSGHHTGRKDTAKRVTLLTMADVPHLRDSRIAVDAVILIPNAPEDIDMYINYGLKVLKSGKMMSIMCSSLEHVSRILQNNFVKYGELVPKIVYEDKDRPWVVKRPQRHPENGAETLYYICRPKHGESCPTGYLIVLLRR